jgi:transposase
MPICAPSGRLIRRRWRRGGHTGALTIDWTIVSRRLDHRAGPSARGRGRKRGTWEGEALGRSRGGLTSKIHLACDGRGWPLAFTLTGGNVNDCTQFESVMAKVRIARPGPGRPRTRPDRVVADKGYSARKIRAYLRRRGIAATIPERIDQINGRIRRGETLCRLDKAAYRRRNVVERCFNRLKQNRAPATRYDKRASHYQAMVTLACLRLWLP